MKRSEINTIIKKFEKMLKEYKFEIPEFCKFTPEEWAEKGHEYDEIRDNMLGWDVTDFGSGDFSKMGLALITLRNGNFHMQDQYPKVYAEKIIMVLEGQECPQHFHWKKMEDIINRGGGNMIFKLYNATEDEQLANTDVLICKDGRRYMVKAGEEVILKPGESISLYPYCYHGYVLEKGKGDVLVGEVSMCNDDNADNKFLVPVGRFAEIEEDEPPYRLLCNEYPAAREE